MDGTVSFAGGNTCCSYGLYVVVDHPNGWQTLYAHMSQIKVTKGQTVNQGEALIVVGNPAGEGEAGEEDEADT